MNSKTAAMFGLDARIALAIFGALSVISGAALFSAIESAKLEKWRQYFIEISKASEQYYLDNAVQIPVHTTSSWTMYIGILAKIEKPYLLGMARIFKLQIIVVML